MIPRPARVVDAHVHLWDPARRDWYPYLQAGPPHGALGGGGDPARMHRRFDLGTYRAEAQGWNVDKLVNVAAATGGHCVEETLALDAAAEAAGGPHAIVGGLPPTDTAAQAIELLERQMAAGRFRGVRPMGGLDQPLPHRDVLRWMAERSLVFELMARPDRLQEAAAGLAGADELVVVVEHTGWPRGADAEERALWKAGIEALARLGERVVCKLSGLAMALASVAAEVLAPWLEPAIEAFGVDRCMFASNFPVDSMYGTFDQLYGAYATVAAGLDDDERAKLFATNAERVYRC
jgi:L-fuconolactonase